MFWIKRTNLHAALLMLSFSMICVLWVGTSSADENSRPLSDIYEIVRDTDKELDNVDDLSVEEKKELQECHYYTMTILDCTNTLLQCLGYEDIPSTESSFHPRITIEDEIMCQIDFYNCSAAVTDEALKRCEQLLHELKINLNLGASQPLI